MKRFLLFALFATLAIFFAAPAALGIFDGWCYTVLGRAVTGVVWNADSVILSGLFLVPAGGCALIVGFVAEEDTGPSPAWVPGPPPPKRPGSNPPPTYARPPMPPAPPPPRDLRGERR